MSQARSQTNLSCARAYRIDHSRTHKPHTQTPSIVLQSNVIHVPRVMFKTETVYDNTPVMTKTLTEEVRRWFEALNYAPPARN